MLVEDFKAQVVFLTETKINKSLPNRQFAIEGNKMYRNEWKKGRKVEVVLWHMLPPD